MLALNDRVQEQRKVMPLGCIAAERDVTHRALRAMRKSMKAHFPKETDAHQGLEVKILQGGQQALHTFKHNIIYGILLVRNICQCNYYYLDQS